MHPTIESALGELCWVRHAHRTDGARGAPCEMLTQLARRGWVLTNPQNPSTKRLLSINVKEVGGGKAVVRTTEYWYLRWWSTIEGKYRYPYRETNHQTYILVETDEGWLLEEHPAGSAVKHSASPETKRFDAWGHLGYDFISRGGTSPSFSE